MLPFSSLKGRTTFWAYLPVRKTQKKSGLICYYCGRAFGSRFKGKYTIQTLKESFGSDLAQLQLFQHWGGMAVTIMVNAGTINVTIHWGTEEEAKQVIQRQIAELKIEDPTDMIMGEEEYKKEHGDISGRIVSSTASRCQHSVHRSLLRYLDSQFSLLIDSISLVSELGPYLPLLRDSESAWSCIRASTSVPDQARICASSFRATYVARLFLQCWLPNRADATSGPRPLPFRRTGEPTD